MEAYVAENCYSESEKSIIRERWFFESIRCRYCGNVGTLRYDKEKGDFYCCDGVLYRY
jgi:hypothetical protein